MISRVLHSVSCTSFASSTPFDFSFSANAPLPAGLGLGCAVGRFRGGRRFVRSTRLFVRFGRTPGHGFGGTGNRPVEEVEHRAATSSDPETALVVRRALARLTSAQRAVLVLRHFDDLTERETAEILGISIGTVKSQNAAALARLRGGAPELLDLIGGSTHD